ncbi:hypothetical protein CKAN_02709900 [Cinnamomum micranthum f. kanehirae]|uniref:Uncharacterized protein n=1 Tax=Cinnamomum micranthum f. kanehirae TaxID=337451 RepID=A0A443Q3P9_9MAGN|nr:hypothetical protein CKAN_02709900 [Cinnamomum micranthum f. kanehirae]
MTKKCFIYGFGCDYGKDPSELLSSLSVSAKKEYIRRTPPKSHRLRDERSDFDSGIGTFMFMFRLVISTNHV